MPEDYGTAAHNHPIHANAPLLTGANCDRDGVEQGFDRDTSVGLLRGILVDSAGVLMQSNHSPKPRNYISIPTSNPLQTVLRVPIIKLDRLVVRIMRRAYLLSADWSENDARGLLHQVHVSERVVMLQLKREACLSVWRARGGLAESTSDDAIIRLVRLWMASHATVKTTNETIMISSQRSFREPVPGPYDNLLSSVLNI